jgi:hypothetical protein
MQIITVLYLLLFFHMQCNANTFFEGNFLGMQLPEKLPFPLWDAPSLASEMNAVSVILAPSNGFAMVCSKDIEILGEFEFNVSEKDPEVFALHSIDFEEMYILDPDGRDGYAYSTQGANALTNMVYFATDRKRNMLYIGYVGRIGGYFTSNDNLATRELGYYHYLMNKHLRIDEKIKESKDMKILVFFMDSLTSSDAKYIVWNYHDIVYLNKYKPNVYQESSAPVLPLHWQTTESLILKPIDDIKKRVQSFSKRGSERSAGED